jgi:hypothetical protein
MSKAVHGQLLKAGVNGGTELWLSETCVSVMPTPLMQWIAD